MKLKIMFCHRNPTPSGQEVPEDLVWPTAGANQDQLTSYVFQNADPPAEAVDGIRPLRLSVELDKYKDRMDFWASLNLAEDNI